ncbi:MAG: M2 family metallopeptidase [Thermoanaerobaculia bacterium]|nr:M2 family metallopeptidase [Thermoanaerobaculia bacterium]
MKYRVMSLVLGAVIALGILPGAAFSEETAPTVAEAEEFLAQAEQKLRDLWILSGRAQWIASTYITEDSEILSAKMEEDVIRTVVDFANSAARFDGLELDYEMDRKMKKLKLALVLPAPNDPAKTEELTRIKAGMEGTYGKGKYCKGEECLNLTELSRVMSSSRDPEALQDAWTGWRTISPVMRKDFSRYVELGNEGARGLGYDDLGSMWRSNYDMEPDAFAAEIDRLWTQVSPFYEALHCYVRAQLNAEYGDEVQSLSGPIRADLLGNMWAQEWGNIYPIVAPEGQGEAVDVTALLVAADTDERDMVRYGEGFFTSLGFEKLPDSFWEKSQFSKPRDREVVCHASAWSLDFQDDLRIKMCIEITEEEFTTIHHELGHNFYQRAYNQQPILFQDSANDGFHEAVGDAIALSVTPDYLVKIGLLDEAPVGGSEIAPLLKMAMDKIAFLPFGLLIDQWRWKVFSGEFGPEDYNGSWWQLREKYQGIEPPVARSEADFDPGAKYHVPANVPYTRYFLARILQFQFHRSLCEAAGFEGPLHECSIYGSKEAGKLLGDMLAMGSSRPWPEALEALTGSPEMDATAILDYFAPLKGWLDEQNEGQTCGW